MELDTQSHHPNPQPQPHHRKIELQSPLDLTYLQQNLAKTALSKLDLHFPPIPKPATVISLDGSSQDPNSNTINKTSSSSNNSKSEIEIEPDPLRTKVQSILSSFLLQTWQSAQSNITLNGLDPSPTTNPIPPSATLDLSPASQFQSSDLNSTADEETTAEPAPPPEIEGKTFQYQPFDPKLQSKLASLYSDLEKLTAEVSHLRRVAPKTGANNYMSSLDSEIEKEDTSHLGKTEKTQSYTEYRQNGASDEFAFRGMEVRKGWNEDLKEIYTRGKEELDSLAGIGLNNSNNNYDQDQNGDKNGNGNGSVSGSTNDNGKRKRDPSLTETMGKVQRARTVALDME